MKVKLFLIFSPVLESAYKKGVVMSFKKYSPYANNG
jgi:hypothetical protein